MLILYIRSVYMLGAMRIGAYNPMLRPNHVFRPASSPAAASASASASGDATAPAAKRARTAMEPSDAVRLDRLFVRDHTIAVYAGVGLVNVSSFTSILI